MSKYSVFFNEPSSITVRVEAEDEEQAIEVAEASLPGSICAQCSGWGETWTRDTGYPELEDQDGRSPVEVGEEQ